MHSLYGQKHRKICISMTKCRAGFATVHKVNTSMPYSRLQKELLNNAWVAATWVNLKQIQKPWATEI